MRRRKPDLAAPAAMLPALPILPALLALPTLLVLLILLAPRPAHAEFRAYRLEVVDLYDCRINKRDKCRSNRVVTAMNPQLYLSTHGGTFHIGVVMLATWMCWGDTSSFKPPCPSPAPNEPKFSVGDDVKISLTKHITEGWLGKVEVAYFQPSVRSNVYGVRFPAHRNVYARYFEKDLKKIGAETPRSTPPQ